uniref:Uncharacterized protein n=1 Tax=Avena sativa TaxID=4498 RepID=A0ACD5XFZ7_AVESA
MYYVFCFIGRMDPQSIQRIKKRKARDEDELMFFVFPALYVHLSTVKKNIRHPSFLYGKRRVREILGGHIKNCLVAFRMEPHIFMWLANYLRDEGLLSDSRLKNCLGAIDGSHVPITMSSSRQAPWRNRKGTLS